MNKPQLFTKGFLIVFFVNFLVVLNFYLLMVTLSLYAMDNFHSSPSEAGFTSTIFIIGVLLSRLWAGRWIERIGRKKTLYVGLILGLAVSLLYFQVNSIIFLFVARFLNGVAFGISSTAAGTLVMNVIPKERRGEGVAYYTLSGTFAAAVGPFLGMLMIQHGNFQTIFLAGAISAVVSLVITFFLVIAEIQLTQEQLRELKEFKFASFFETKAIPISLFFFIIYFCYSSILTFLSAYVKEIQLVDAASFFFIVISAVILISRPISGRLFDLKGENFIMYPAILVLTMGMMLISQTHHGYTLLLAGALIGLGLGAVQSSCQTIAVKVTEPHRTGLAISTFFFLLDSGLGIGPFIFGLIIPFSGYRGMYAGTAIVVLASIFLYHLLHGKKAWQGKRDLGQNTSL